MGKRERFLELLAKEDEQTLALSYMYAKNMHDYGTDVTQTLITATQQNAALHNAYKRGYQEGYQEADESWRKYLSERGE